MRCGRLVGGFAGLATALLLLAACGEGERTQQAAPPEAPPVLPEPFRWEAIAPSTFDPGPPAVLHLSEGYGFAYFPQTGAMPGEKVTAHISFRGEKGRPVTFILQRHCDAANGSDNELHSVQLTGAQQTVEFSHTFSQYYSCIRVSALSPDHRPLDVTVDELVVTKTPPAEPQGGG